jgi:uncharacterized protein (TIGR04222 family)
MNIDGVLLTAIYTGLVGATAGAAVLADGTRRVPDTAADHLDEYDVAFLTGGSRLAAVVALVNLERGGLIDLGDNLLRDLRDSGDLDLDAVRDADHLVELGVELHVSVMNASVATTALTHPVEAAALQAVQGTKPGTPWRVVSAVTATKALGEVRRGLVQRGLLHELSDIERLQRRWRWLLPLLLFALWRLVAGDGGWPLLGAMVLTVVAMVALARRQPETTRRGDRLVAEIRRRHAESPDTSVASGPAPGLALALAGTAGLWAGDPALALAVDIPSWAVETPVATPWRESVRGWWDSEFTARTGGWSGGAGCGGGWGSGWGGGGGCGGGGGGCGGGGGGGCGGGGCGGGG